MAILTTLTNMFKPIAKPVPADLFENKATDIHEPPARKQEQPGAMCPNITTAGPPLKSGGKIQRFAHRGTEYLYRMVLDEGGIFGFLLDDISDDIGMTERAAVTAIKDYVDFITNSGDLLAAKSTMRALTAYNLKNGHRYDGILMNLNTWIIANNKESVNTNNFYGKVAAAGCNIDQQLAVEPMPAH